MKTKGYVYIFSNEEHLNKIKIGCSSKHPEIRADKLNSATGVIGKYKLIWFQEVDNMNLYEKVLHYFFNEYKYQKEFFKIDPVLATSIAKKIITNFQKTEKLIPTIIEKRKKIILIRLADIKEMVKDQKNSKTLRSKLQSTQDLINLYK